MITQITVLNSEAENEFKACHRASFPYVDRVIVVHDDSISEEFLTWMWRCGIETFERTWNDNWADAKNYAIQQVKDGEWILDLDSDEVISKQLGQNLRQIVKDSNGGRNYNIVSFKCLDILKLKDQEFLLKSVSHWQKELLYQKQPGLHYIGPVHLTLQGELKGIKTSFIFYHVKTPEKWFKRYCHYFWVAGERVHERSDVWKEFRNLCESVGITSWESLHQKMKEGTLPNRVKKWIEKWRNDTYCVERRAFYTLAKYYHPEQFRDTEQKEKFISIGDNIIDLAKELKIDKIKVEVERSGELYED